MRPMPTACYQAYEYDAESGAWLLTGEHEVDAALLAGR